MTRKILLITLVSFATLTSAQSLDDLDYSNGFKEFIFGTHKSHWGSKLIFAGVAQEGDSNPWVYTGDCCKTAFGEDVSSSKLEFNKEGKLIRVQVYLKDRYSFNEQERVCSVIRRAFGNSYLRDANEDTGDIICEWQAKYVALSMISDYKQGDDRGWDVVLVFTDMESFTKPSKDY